MCARVCLVSISHTSALPPAALALSGFTQCAMAEGGGPEPGNTAEPVAEPVPAQTPLPSIDSQKQTIGALLKTTLRKGDEW